MDNAPLFWQTAQCEFLAQFIKNSPIVNQVNLENDVLPLIYEITNATKQSVVGGKGQRAQLFYGAVIDKLPDVKDQIKLIGVAIELFQSAMLVHDDIIDEDEMRRGQKSVYKALGSQKAIIVGDLLLVAADEAFNNAVSGLFATTILNLRQAQKLHSIWSTMKRDVLFGQSMDFTQSNIDLQNINYETLQKSAKNAIIVNFMKTVSYTYTAPYLLSSVILSGSDVFLGDFANDEQYTKFLVEGLNFQLENDISGLEKDINNGNLSSGLLRLLEYIYNKNHELFSKIANVISTNQKQNEHNMNNNQSIMLGESDYIEITKLMEELKGV